MRVAVVTPFYKPAYRFGGPVRSVSSLCEGLKSSGWDVEVLTTTATGEKGTELPAGTHEVEGVNVRYFAQRNLNGRLFYSPDLARYAAQHARTFDVAYVYGIWNYPAIAATREFAKARTPYVVSPRSSLMQWPMAQNRMAKQLYLRIFGQRLIERAAGVHYTTAVEQSEGELLGIPAQSFVLSNPMNLDEFQVLPAAGAFRKRVGLAPQAPLSLYLGRLERRKGVDLALRSFARVRAQMPAARFVVAGPDKRGYRTELLSLAAQLGLGESVCFVDYLDARQRLEAFVDADLFVLTSYSDNFAMAAVEAMAAGTPALLTPAVGVAQAAARAGGARMVALDPAEIANAWVELLASSSLRAEMGAAGMRHVREMYSIPVVTRQMHEQLTRIARTAPNRVLVG